jgi:hypothetical protein
MPSWLIDNPLIYMLLATVAVALIVAWWRTRQGKYVIALVVTGGLIGLVWLLGNLFESDARQIARKLNEMRVGVQAHDLDRIFANVSDSFRLGSYDKPAFRRRSDEAMRMHNVTDVAIWDFDVKSISRKDRIAHVQFGVKPHTSFGNDVPYLCRAAFVLDQDNQWRLKTFQVFNPYVDTKQPLAIPGL